MNGFLNILSAALIAVFLQNSILERALGANVLIYASRKKEHVIGFFVAITYTTTISSPLVWLLDNYLGNNSYYHLIMPLLYILIIGIIYVVTLVIIWRFAPKLFNSLKKYVHLSVFNCSVVGALFLCSYQGSDIFTYLGYGLGTGIGFLLAAYLLYIATERLNSPLVPDAFRGFPIMLVYVGILSLALYAFTGYTTSAF
ncbi:MAG: Rnf-Nqr domain containing protein [Ruminiclostridium sp.]